MQFGGVMRTVNIGLLGLGQIGSEVYRLISRKKSLFQEKYGVRFEIKKILVKSKAKKRFNRLDSKKLTTKAKDVLEDPSIDLVIELIGGINPAKKLVLQALANGKDVITANKALLAEEGEEIYNTARKFGRQLFFEASVGGGIPVIKSLRDGLSANKVDSILGIINGTSNYILTQMSQNGVDFNSALKEAQEKGFAELDPTFDIEGVDAAHKIAILARLSYNRKVPFKSVYCEGIQHITKQDIDFAERFGYCIKLLAIAKQVKDGIEARVQPTLLPKDHMLSKVDGSFNAILFKGDEVGDVLLYGQGAGPQPTASAVMADVIDWAKGIESFIPKVGVNHLNVKNISSILSRYYLRFSVIDKPGVLSFISGILGKHNVSISDVIQKEQKSGTMVPLILLTYNVNEQNIRQAIKKIDSNRSMIRAKTRIIRIEG